MRKEAMHKLKKSILLAMGVFILVPYDKNILESAGAIKVPCQTQYENENFITTLYFI